MLTVELLVINIPERNDFFLNMHCTAVGGVKWVRSASIHVESPLFSMKKIELV